MFAVVVVVFTVTRYFYPPTSTQPVSGLNMHLDIIAVVVLTIFLYTYLVTNGLMGTILHWSSKLSKTIPRYLIQHGLLRYDVS